MLLVVLIGLCRDRRRVRDRRRQQLESGNPARPRAAPSRTQVCRRRSSVSTRTAGSRARQAHLRQRHQLLLHRQRAHLAEQRLRRPLGTELRPGRTAGLHHLDRAASAATAPRCRTGSSAYTPGGQPLPRERIVRGRQLHGRPELHRHLRGHRIQRSDLLRWERQRERQARISSSQYPPSGITCTNTCTAVIEPSAITIPSTSATVPSAYAAAAASNNDSTITAATWSADDFTYTPAKSADQWVSNGTVEPCHVPARHLLLLRLYRPTAQTASSSTRPRQRRPATPSSSTSTPRRAAAARAPLGPATSAAARTT